MPARTRLRDGAAPRAGRRPGARAAAARWIGARLRRAWCPARRSGAHRRLRRGPHRRTNRRARASAARSTTSSAPSSSMPAPSASAIPVTNQRSARSEMAAAAECARRNRRDLDGSRRRSGGAIEVAREREAQLERPPDVRPRHRASRAARGQVRHPPADARRRAGRAPRTVALAPRPRLRRSRERGPISVAPATSSARAGSGSSDARSRATSVPSAAVSIASVSRQIAPSWISARTPGSPGSSARSCAAWRARRSASAVRPPSREALASFSRRRPHGGRAASRAGQAAPLPPPRPVSRACAR